MTRMSTAIVHITYCILPNIRKAMCNSVSSIPLFVKWKEKNL